MTLAATIDGFSARLPRQVGWRAWALGIMAIGLVGLLVGDFVSGQPAPKWLPGRTSLAYAAAGLLLLAGAAAQWRRATVWAVGAITAYYALIVVLLMDGRIILRHFAEFQAYNGTSEQVALTAAGVIVFASQARIDPALAQRLISWSRRAFGVAAILFGVAHFLYMNLTAPLVPAWLPPSQAFWGYATGVFHILGGLAILTGVQARLAAILLALMYAAFTPLVHLPMLLADPHNHFVWSENAVNVALAGAAWVVADSLAPPRRP
jgi:uncharacterized membrane protein